MHAKLWGVWLRTPHKAGFGLREYVATIFATFPQEEEERTVMSCRGNLEEPIYFSGDKSPVFGKQKAFATKNEGMDLPTESLPYQHQAAHQTDQSKKKSHCSSAQLHDTSDGTRANRVQLAPAAARGAAHRP